MGLEAGQELYSDSRNIELEQLHSGPCDKVPAQEGPGIDREIHLSPIKQTRWQELRTALRLHGQ